MQGSVFRAQRGEVSTYAFYMQNMADELSSVEAVHQLGRARALRARLRARYGCGTGRGLMLGRAQRLEALAGAFMDNSELTYMQTQEVLDVDEEWARRWWNVVLPMIRHEENVLVSNNLCVMVDSGPTEPDAETVASTPEGGEEGGVLWDASGGHWTCGRPRAGDGGAACSA